MSELIKYLKENTIVSNYKIYHKKITSDHIIDEQLHIEIFDRLPNTVIGKRAIYFMFNNVNITEKDYCEMIFDNAPGNTGNIGKRELTYYKYIQPYYHMITHPIDGIYMYSFSLHPTVNDDSEYITMLSAVLRFEKVNDEEFEINDKSSITYVVQHN